ncbi:hypothetical protein H2199_003530 [Coniosporium tulheliwenetii]|uniref:Uncharacterized protein n=1 Tax=Coniosporium tulheliwenetii TaxID=3383036 RepID=A0ACC2ZBD5_9PEZI|nr:hypothetical protein H2199_003530 [Cladosporium sp. JES 115]
MSYNGPPAGGATPYQQPAQPFGNGQQMYGQQPYGPPQGQQGYGQQLYAQPQYGQPQYPQSFQQGGPPQQGLTPQQGSNAFPPKKKGNPIITRYPPPPGYRGPAQHQNGPPQPFQPPQGYQAPPQTYPQQPPQGYPPQQGYQQPPNYQQAPQGYQQPPPQGGYPPQQQGWQQPQGWQAPPQGGYPPQQQGFQQPGYPPQQGYQQPPQGYQAPPQGYAPQQGYPPAQGYPQQGYPPLQGSPDGSAPPPNYQGPNPQWQPPPQQPYPPQSEQWANPPQHTASPSGPPVPTTERSTPTQGQRHPSRAMSMTSDRTTVPKPSENDPAGLALDDWDFDFDGALWPKGCDAVDPDLSIGIIIWHPATQATRAVPSTFAEAEKRDEDVPYAPLGNGESVSKYFTLENDYEAFLDVRQTDHWPTVQNDPIFIQFPATCDLIPLEDVIANRDRPDIEEDEPVANGGNGEQVPNGNVMDSLEQALDLSEIVNGRRSSVKPAAGPKDDGQEDILARLGVTGSPKPVFPTPGPAYVPRSRSDSWKIGNSGLPRPNSFAFSNDGMKHYGAPPPPPEPQRSPSYDPWKTDDTPRASRFDGKRDPSPARSDKTATGSDFHADDTNGTNSADMKAPPTLLRSESSTARKRSYDESDRDRETEGRRRQEDDVTPKYKRRQPRVAAAYR